MIVVSLTTIPSRFKDVGSTLYSIMRQTQRIDSVHLYVPRHYHRFPDYAGELPEVPEGVKVERHGEDVGPATKAVFAIEQFRRNPDARLIYCDDDRIYPRRWAEQLVEASDERPGRAICYAGFDIGMRGFETPAHDPQPRAAMGRRPRNLGYRLARLKQMLLDPKGRKPHRPSRRTPGYVHIAEGFGGVLVRPYMMPRDTLVVPDECFYVDDIYLSALLARAGGDPWLIKGESMGVAATSGNAARDALASQTFDGLGRVGLDQLAIEYCQNEWNIWMDETKEEHAA